MSKFYQTIATLHALMFGFLILMAQWFADLDAGYLPYVCIVASILPIAGIRHTVRLALGE
jgi:hypothetical protein